jgi:hypothetical protein
VKEPASRDDDTAAAPTVDADGAVEDEEGEEGEPATAESTELMAQEKEIELRHGT